MSPFLCESRQIREQWLCAFFFIRELDCETDSPRLLILLKTASSHTNHPALVPSSFISTHPPTHPNNNHIKNSIPFALATSLGLAALAMQLPLTGDEAGSGLVPPATALFVLGKGGATLILIMLFMAVTSTGSAELIAVSSLISYDVYRAYINKDATGDEILKVSRITVFVFGALMGVLSIVLNEIGLSLGWVYLFMGVVIGSAVVPVSMVLTWKKATAKVRGRGGGGIGRSRVSC